MTTKEAYNLLEHAHFLKNDLVLPITPEDVETRRRIVDFIHEVDTARFMLAMSYKHPYLDLVDEYHNSFDLVLQCLWFKHRLYGNIQLQSDNIEKILCDCKLPQIQKLLYNNQEHNPISDFNKRNHEVHDLANRLKHRQYIENDNYLLYSEALNVVSDGYNSDATKFHKKLADIQSKLVNYHKDIIGLAKEILLPIHNSISNILEES